MRGGGGRDRGWPGWLRRVENEGSRVAHVCARTACGRRNGLTHTLTEARSAHTETAGREEILQRDNPQGTRK